MTWAKKMLHWAETPERALDLCIDLNDRYALDGRDPNSYLGLLWCFGLMDRPYDRDDDITGSLRPRSTDWHASQIQLQDLESVVYTTSYDPDPSVGIVGVGMAGASCSKILQNHGINVQLYEKSRGHGGRASTRYKDSDGTVTFDHGAQYLTIRNALTEKYKNSWLRDDVLREWDVDPAVIEGDEIGQETGTRRFVPVPTMNQIVKDLTDEAHKHFETRIETITTVHDQYRLIDADGNEYRQVFFSPDGPAPTDERFNGGPPGNFDSRGCRNFHAPHLELLMSSGIRTFRRIRSRFCERRITRSLDRTKRLETGS
jgi:hypothetical protein